MRNVGMIPTPEIPTQLQPGQRCAVFRGGPRLFVELDGALCSQVTPQNAIRAIADVRARFEKDFPVLATVLSSPAAGIAGKWAFGKAKLMIGATAMKAGGIILVYIAVHLIVRWTALQVHHRNSRLGGVLIEYGPPYWPVEVVPIIHPRGGYKGDKLDQAREAAWHKIGAPAKSALAAVKSNAGTIRPARWRG